MMPPVHRLYLLRHGLADPAGWTGDDEERPLTAEGRRRLQRTARALVHLELGCGLILTSPLERTMQTARIVAQGLGLADRCAVDERLRPGSRISDVAGILRDHAAIDRLMLVGHEPDLSLLVGALTGGLAAMKKGALARIDLMAHEQQLRGRLAWLLPPGVLYDLGEALARRSS